MTTIALRLQAVNNLIASLPKATQQVKLLAVSKTWPAAAVREAYNCGQKAFGESYIQEAVEKIGQLSDLDIEWHFIGPLQSNKTRLVAENFAWAHSVDREKIARRLSEARPAGKKPLQVCIQVNLSGEKSKSGVKPDEALDLARRIAKLPNITLRGLMTIPEPGDSILQHRRFSQLRQLKEQIEAEGIVLDTLSMGMSQDLQAAIIEGATIVRVGSAIFGQRE